MSTVPAHMHDDLWPTPGDSIFVRPDWPAIQTAIDTHLSGPEGRLTAWRFAVDRWIQMTVDVLNQMLEVSHTRRFPYRVDRSEHFAFITPYSESIAGELPTLGEGFRNLARQILGPRIAKDPPAGCPVFIFHDPHVAQEYLLAYGTNAFAIAGLCLLEPPQHIVLHTAERFQLRLVLLHELNHAALHALPIPHWVHEGLSRYFETRLLTMADMRYADELDLGRNRFWREHGLADFWSGAVFYDQRAPAGYVLAHRFIRSLLARSAASFTEFLLQANQRDSGDAACRTAYGFSLLDLTRELIGKGDWQGPPPIPAT